MKGVVHEARCLQAAPRWRTGVLAAATILLAGVVFPSARSTAAHLGLSASPSGTVFYVDDVDGDRGTRWAQVFKINGDGSGRVGLTHWWREATGVTPSPDGRRLVFGMTDHRTDGHVSYVSNADGSRRHRLCNGYFAGWSPDG